MAIRSRLWEWYTPGLRAQSQVMRRAMFFPLSTTPLVNPNMDDLNDIHSAWLSCGEAEARREPDQRGSRHESSLASAPRRSTCAHQQFRATHSPRLSGEFEVAAGGQCTRLFAAAGSSPRSAADRDGHGRRCAFDGVRERSSLLLVRAAGRVREMSVRYSLGASQVANRTSAFDRRPDPGSVGGALGLALVPAVSSVLAHKLVHRPDWRPPPSRLHPTIASCLFNFGLALLVSLLFSVAPALRFLHPDLVNSLKQQSGTATGSNLRFRRLSVGLQIGLSLLLLMGAGLFVQTLRNLRDVNVGFTTDHLLSSVVDPQLAGYKEDQGAALQQRIIHSLSALPGVRSVGATTEPELMGDGKHDGRHVARAIRPTNRSLSRGRGLLQAIFRRLACHCLPAATSTSRTCLTSRRS